MPGDSASLEELLQRGIGDGVITTVQAEVMRGYAEEGRSAAAAARRGVVGEALGFLGGAVLLAGAVLVAARYWSDLGTAWRLAVLGAATLTLLLAGAATRTTSLVGVRLRSLLWIVSLAIFGGLLTVLTDRVLDVHGRGAPLVVAGGCAVFASLLWLLSRLVLQQVAMMVAWAAAAAAATHRVFDSPNLPGLAAWGVGVAWVVLGATGVLTPRWVAVVLGSATAIVGAMFTAGTDAGMILTLATIVVVIGTSVVMRDLALLVVGAVGALFNLPAAVSTWFPDSVVAAFALLVVGALLVVASVVVVARDGRDLRTWWDRGGPREGEGDQGSGVAVPTGPLPH